MDAELDVEPVPAAERLLDRRLDALDVVGVDPLAPLLVAGELGGDEAVQRRQLRSARDGSARAVQLPDADVAARLREPQACLALVQLAVALRAAGRRAAEVRRREVQERREQDGEPHHGSATGALRVECPPPLAEAGQQPHEHRRQEGDGHHLSEQPSARVVSQEEAHRSAAVMGEHERRAEREARHDRRPRDAGQRRHAVELADSEEPADRGYERERAHRGARHEGAARSAPTESEEAPAHQGEARGADGAHAVGRSRRRCTRRLARQDLVESEVDAEEVLAQGQGANRRHDRCQENREPPSRRARARSAQQQQCDRGSNECERHVRLHRDDAANGPGLRQARHPGAEPGCPEQERE